MSVAETLPDATFPRLRRAVAAVIIAAACAPAQAATLASPEHEPETVAEIRLAPQEPCRDGVVCAVTITAVPHATSRDPRRIAFLLEWPDAPLSAEGAWHCRGLAAGESLCLASLGEIQRGATATLTLPALKQAPRHLCLRDLDLPPPGPIEADPLRIRLIQMLLLENGQKLPAIDGVWAGDTRLKATALARSLDIPAGDETLMATALIGATLNRLKLAHPACITLQPGP